ncbi:benzoate 4-monooxygenase cytochrome p450 [Moniliophthora roreri]|nr:benzoate 4-monooxygenase cytochrome p450 [Moniliophthora roreri]
MTWGGKRDIQCIKPYMTASQCILTFFALRRVKPRSRYKAITRAFIIVSLLYTKKFSSDPLSRFPGPALARWTWMYRAYYDSVVGGHVVRVGHNELHFSDPLAYPDIYATNLRKDPHLYEALEFGLVPNTFSTTNPKDHAVMRSMLGSFFSRKGVQKLEHVIQERVDKLVLQLAKNHKTVPADMYCAFRCVTLDIITLYTLRTSLDATSYPSFLHPALLDIDMAMPKLWSLKHMVTVKRVLECLPMWLAVLVAPSSKPILKAQAEIAKLVDIALQDSRDYDPDSDIDLNVFHTLIRNARDEGKRTQGQSNRVTKEWLVAEGSTLRVAGSDTVGNACTIGARCLVRDDRVRARLVDELETAWPDKGIPMPLKRLEKLPYLTAVIKESLRLSFGTATPMNRVVPDSGAVIAGHPVPPGTIVSMANPFVHMNSEIYPEPTRFYPERWLEDHDHSLDRYLVSFGKGNRSCLGINLAWSELYLTLGNVFRKLNLSSDSDLMSEAQFKEFFVPIYQGEVLNATVTERL